jgi:hypothetical protein
MMFDAFGEFPSGGPFSAADLSVVMLFCLALFSHLTLRAHRPPLGQVALLLVMGLCCVYEVMDRLYDTMAVTLPVFPNPLVEYDRAWTWFEAAVASGVGALLAASHACVASAAYERTLGGRDLRHGSRWLRSADVKHVRALAFLMAFMSLASMAAGAVVIGRL